MQGVFQSKPNDQTFLLMKAGGLMCGQKVFLLMKVGRLVWGWVGMTFVEEVVKKYPSNEGGEIDVGVGWCGCCWGSVVKNVFFSSRWEDWCRGGLV